MSVVLAGMGLIILTGCISLFIKTGTRALRLGAAGVIAGAAAGIAACVGVLISGVSISIKLPWQVPYGSFYAEIDPLTAIFLIPILLLSAIGAIYGCGYMKSYKDRWLGGSVFFFNMLVAGMAMVVMARNGVLFLLAWEVMSLASYFLVTFDDEHEAVRQAGWIYIIATHIGAAFLLAFFVLLGKECGSLDFDKFGALKTAGPCAASALFLLAVAGFGTKAGIMPMHVWLPEAHPAAPSHVSALMSGVMIKTGIYGIIRTISILPGVELWWGWLLIVAGVVSGVLGILFALAQHDIKRMLAYSSVENIGIILMGLGLGVVGMSTHSQVMMIFGFAGAMLHMINHSLFKGLLFMGAGAVVHATGTRYMDLMGGLVKRMPSTAAAFAVGAIAICAIPPFNGFMGEFLLYYGSLSEVLNDGVRSVAPTILVIGSLAIIGGFALAAFTKVFGIVFLGEPRSDKARESHEANPEMLCAMWMLGGLCAAASIGAPVIIRALGPAITSITALDATAVSIETAGASAIICTILMALGSLLILVLVLAKLRSRLLAGRVVEKGITWDCGYAAEVPRIQYTSSSFSQPIVAMFQSVLGSRRRSRSIHEIFPKQARFESNTPDVSNEYLYRPIFKWVDKAMSKMRWVQYGTVQLYVLYIALALIAVIVWKLR